MSNAIGSLTIMAISTGLLITLSVALTVAARSRRWAVTPAIICWGLALMAASATYSMSRPELAKQFRHAIPFVAF